MSLLDDLSTMRRNMIVATGKAPASMDVGVEFLRELAKEIVPDCRHARGQDAETIDNIEGEIFAAAKRGEFFVFGCKVTLVESGA